MARFRAFLLIGVCLPACLPLTGCEPVAIALLGAGASTAIRYNMDGVASRTFTAPAAAVKHASLAALERMGLTHDATIAFDSGETIYAKAPNRDIEIDIETITKHATRLRIVAKGGSFLYDTATATELVQQTDRLLEAGLAKLVPAVPAAAAAAPIAGPAAAGASKAGF
jgi:hypothetical protein